jgi:hypothetical protein
MNMDDSRFGQTGPNIITNELEEGEIYSPQAKDNDRQPYYN